MQKKNLGPPDLLRCSPPHWLPGDRLPVACSVRSVITIDPISPVGGDRLIETICETKKDAN